MSEQNKNEQHWQKYRKPKRNKWRTPLSGNPFGFITYEEMEISWLDNMCGNLWQSPED